MWLNVQGSSAGALGIAGCSGRLETDQSFEKTSREFLQGAKVVVENGISEIRGAKVDSIERGR